jgi:glucose 1-dehydrogenase
MRTIVTGAARGIGRAIAQRLAENAGPAPAQLMLVDQHDAELQALANNLRNTGAEVRCLNGNIGEPTLPAAIAEAVADWGGLDGLVSNAGYAQPGDLVDYKLADWDQMFAVNVRAHWLLARACFTLLRAAGGKVVFTTSISGSHPTTPLGAYSSCKAALLMLMRQLAVEWGPLGIRVNAVSPGMTVTEGTAAIYADAQVRQQREARIPVRRIGQPQDIAAAVFYLLGPDAAYVQGQDLLVDGGLSQTVMANPLMDGWRQAPR